MNQNEVSSVYLPKIGKSISINDPSWVSRISIIINRQFSWIDRANPNLNSSLIKYTRPLNRERGSSSEGRRKGQWFSDHRGCLIIDKILCNINSKENKIMPTISKSSNNLKESTISRRIIFLSRCQSINNRWFKFSTSNNPWSHKEDISRWGIPAL
jgi:hypothetical protein